jgi:hypothetical protein
MGSSRAKRFLQQDFASTFDKIRHWNTRANILTSENTTTTCRAGIENVYEFIFDFLPQEIPVQGIIDTLQQTGGTIDHKPFHRPKQRARGKTKIAIDTFDAPFFDLTFKALYPFILLCHIRLLTVFEFLTITFQNSWIQDVIRIEGRFYLLH